MNTILEEALVAARYSARLYFAPFVGAVRGAVEEVRHVRREMNREVSALRHANDAKNGLPRQR